MKRFDCFARSLVFFSSSLPFLSHLFLLIFLKNSSPFPSKQCWLEHDGRPLPSNKPLGASLDRWACSSENHNNSLFSVSCCVRACGGGGDGGSTGAESRASYLEMYAAAKPDAIDPALVAATRATACALSGKLLQPPLVADALGSLFNKEAVLSGLVTKTLPPALAHVSSIKHVFDARVTEIGSEQGNGNANGHAHGGEDGSGGGKKNKEANSLAPRFCCPITGIHLNGRNKFLLLRPSGLVVSERAVRVAMPAVEEAVAEELSKNNASRSSKTAAVAANGKEEKTSMKIDLSSAIRLLPPLSELTAAREKLLLERAAEVAARAERKKPKKRKGGCEGGAEEEVEQKGSESSSKKSAEEEAAERKRRIAASTAALAPAGADKEVFASLFLSSKKDSEKESFGCRSTGLGRR